MQDLSGKLKIVKVEADPNPGLVEKYKVCSQAHTHAHLRSTSCNSPNVHQYVVSQARSCQQLLMLCCNNRGHFTCLFLRIDDDDDDFIMHK